METELEFFRAEGCDEGFSGEVRTVSSLTHVGVYADRWCIHACEIQSTLAGVPLVVLSCFGVVKSQAMKVRVCRAFLAQALGCFVCPKVGRVSVLAVLLKAFVREREGVHVG